MKRNRSPQGQKDRRPKADTVKFSRSKSKEWDKLKKRLAVIGALNLNEPCHHDALMAFYHLWNEWNNQYFYGIFDEEHTPVIIIEPLLLDSSYQGRYTKEDVSADEMDLPNDLADPDDLDGPEYFSSIRLCETILTGEGNPLWKEGEKYSEGRFRYVADVMLHEMVHGFCYSWRRAPKGKIDWYDLANRDSQRQTLFYPSVGLEAIKAAHHGFLFCLMCNQIADHLNLKHVRCAEIEEWEYGEPGDERDQPLCDFFPLNVRPDGYYLNARLGDPD